MFLGCPGDLCIYVAGWLIDFCITGSAACVLDTHVKREGELLLDDCPVVSWMGWWGRIQDRPGATQQLHLNHAKKRSKNVPINSDLTWTDESCPVDKTSQFNILSGIHEDLSGIMKCLHLNLS